jgi:hypothetical protein
VPLNWVLSADTATFIRRATRAQDALENDEEAEAAARIAADQR